MSGQLEELKMLRADGCPWNEDTCFWAATRGHLGVLQWARANGCPWCELTHAKTADLGYVESDGSLSDE